MGSKKEKLDLSVVLMVLAMAGMAVKYIYFSSIGNWEEPFHTATDLWQRGVGFLGVLVVGGLLDLGFYFLKGGVDRIKAAGFPPTVVSLLLLLVMTSFSVPTWLFLAAALLISLLGQLKVSLSLSTVAAYFLLVFISSQIMEAPAFLTAPYLETMGGTWEEFRRYFYSLLVVAAGISRGPLSFSLLVPILAGSLLLANRKYGPMLWSLLFFLVFSAASALYIGIVQWQLPLFLLNGSVLVVGVFFLPWELKNLLPGASKAIYTSLLGIAAFIFSYYVNYIWGVYLAFLLVHLLLKVGILLDKVTKKP